MRRSRRPFSLAGSYLHAAHFAGGFDQRAAGCRCGNCVSTPCSTAAVPLQAHAGIDVLAGQRPQVVRRDADAIELREHQVPDLDFAAGRRRDRRFRCTGRRRRRDLGWGRRPARNCRPRPCRSILFRRQLDVAGPDFGRLVVVEVDRHGQPAGVQARAILDW